jgi:sulfhydrogenase subunit delta
MASGGTPVSGATDLGSASRPRLAVFKLTSCDGCQLQLMDSADALLALAGALDIVHFPEATGVGEGPFDIAIIEGSISTDETLAEVLSIRDRSRFVVTIGACATAGGVQALRNLTGTAAPSPVYANADLVRSLASSTPVAAHITVDLELHGCPVDPGQLLGALSALLEGSVPRVPGEPVCIECKRRGFVCVIVAKGEACLGPVTRTGCGALCPGMGRGCYGCFGPADTTNAPALSGQLQKLGMGPGEIAQRYRMITPAAVEFRTASEEARRR